MSEKKAKALCSFCFQRYCKKPGYESSMAGNEDVEALENVLVRATSLLDTLNDAIERAVRQENLLYYQGPTKSR